jgi:hypothetical protein
MRSDDQLTDSKKAELYDHMEAVAKANGFDSLTDAITHAVKYRGLVVDVGDVMRRYREALKEEE